MNIKLGITKDDIRIERDGDMWSAYYEKLGLDSFGETEEEAKDNLMCAIALYIKSLLERDILAERMKEKNIDIRIFPTIDTVILTPYQLAIHTDIKAQTTAHRARWRNR